MDRPSPFEPAGNPAVDGGASPLIGRDHPAAVLRAEVARTTRSHGGLVLVTGEAGIGKTALVTDAADRARRQGALVLSGACWDSCDAPGHWPWTQVLRALRRGTTAHQWAEAEKTADGGLAVLLGEAPGAADSAAGGAEGEFHLHDAVTRALVAVSQYRPLVLVLEDLHWADPASLRLLRFAAGHTWFERLLLVGTYRDDELEADGHPLRPLVLPLLTRAVTVTLTGLDRAGTGALIARTAGRRPTEELVGEVHRRTGGNPFFVEQTARLWHGGGTAAAVAPGVRDTLRHRLSLLPEAVVRLLGCAAVLGREFHRAVLAAVAGEPASRVDRLLARALTNRLVTALGAGRFAFAHDLVRETLYESLGEAERRRLHASAVGALRSATAPAGEVLPADLARHARLAGNEIEAPRALEILLAAARDAGGRLAVEEAAGHHRRALELAAARGDRRRQVLIALDLGGELEYLGEREAARRAFTEAVGAARETGDPGLLARVALTLYREETQRLSPGGAGGPPATDLMHEAYDRLVGGRAPGAGSSGGADGSGASAPAAGTASGRPATLDRLARELTVGLAVRARRGGDDEALLFGLWARHNAVWGPGSAPERVALTTELMSVARRRADLETEYLAASFRWVALLEQGDPGFLDQYRAFTVLAERAGLPHAGFSSCVDRSIIATLTGRFEAVEPLLDRAEEYFTQRRHPHIGYMIDHLRWALRLQQGRFDELTDLHRSLAGHGHPQRRILEGITALERDGPGDAAAAPALAAEIDAAGPVSPFFVPLWLRLRAQTAAVADDPGLCERVRADLLPFSGQWAVSLYGCDVSGPMDLWLGVVEAARGHWDEAVEHLTAAHRSADLLGARPWSVRARLELARALLAGGAPEDGRAAAVLLPGVVREADGLGMRHLAERARRTGVGRTGHGPVPLPVAQAPEGPEAGGTREARKAPESVFRFDGEVWTLTYRGRTVHLPDAKGLRDLRLLLGRPGEDVPAVRLLNPAGGATAVAARRLGGDPVLDEEARARYRERLVRLDEEIDRAAALGHDDRAAAFDREREALLGELRAAAGLAGRTRRLGDEAERARKAVTARIRDTLRRLDRRHPELAAHLRAAVSTGAACRYLPPDGDGPAWRL
ncbi:AAA family ATPase [Streptomyces sp. TRM 70361]|uniref:AAA family ATPase n=1 Tax=Streptomyces sp. TRM 70361 TaxID=3116553 RepID=UPI002E7AFC17|nr:AAA family ATPase [Streptomyces sp. TRM 70361]MEE1941161.1 AAA family ATPase [Streptomyces sp. TRM 70361]